MRDWLKVGTRMLVLEIALVSVFVVPAAIYAATTLNKTISIKTNDPNIDLTRGLVGWYTFDGGDMLPNVVDKSGSGHTGHLVGFTSTTTVSGKVGQALSFAGSGDYVELGNWGATGYTAISVCAWVKPSSAGAREDYVTEWVAGAGGGSQFNLLQGTTPNKFTFFIFDTNFLASSNSTTTIVPGTWYHLCGTYNGGNALRLYVNGVQEGADVTTGGALSAGGGTNTFIGKSADAETGAAIDDVRIYSRALSAAEVKRIYGLGGTTYLNTSVASNKATSPSATSGLVSWWTFDGANLLQNVVDSSGNGNTGLLISFTSTTTRAGKIGQGLLFDAVDDVVIFSTTLLTAGSPFAISWWENPNSTGVADPMRFIFDMSGTTNDFAVFRGTSGSYANLSWGPVPDAVSCIRASGAPSVASSVGEWHHFVIMGSDPNSSTPSDYTVYVDGVSTAASDGSTLGAASANNKMGYDALSGSGANAILDDVRVYNRQLSATEVKRLYDQGGTTYLNTTVNQNTKSATLETGLVGHWTFDGSNLLQNAGDSSGKGNTGFLSGFTSTSSAIALGRLGQALTVSSTLTNAVVKVPASSSLNDLAAMTVSAWIKLASYPATGARIVAKRSAAADSGWWDFNVNNSGFLNFGADYDSTDLSRDNATAIPLNEWTHVVATWDGSATATNVKFYINGVESTYGTTQNGITSRNSDAAQLVGIGNWTGGNRVLGGTIDDARVYNRVLSADEVKRLYQLGQ